MESNDNNAENGGDVPDTFGFRQSSSSSVSNAPLVVHKEAYFYKMNHPQRGKATIFNHEKFLFPNLKDRNGTATDCANLKSCLENIGFEVTVHQDLASKQLMDEIDKLSKMDYSSMDCSVICVLSHGEEGIIYSKDSAYKYEKLWEKFTGNKCKTLAGKPKIFFIQACQGTMLDPGVNLTTELDGKIDSYKIPIHADFLFAYSTIPGTYFSDRPIKKSKLSSCLGTCFKSKSEPVECQCGFYSWRNTGRGSWFIQALCAELSENAFTYDLLTLLTFVNRRVATDFESNVPGDRIMHAQRQIPCIVSMLTRLVRFTPKK